MPRMSHIQHNLPITSEDGPEATIIDCEYAGYRIRYCNSNDPTSVLDGFTITNASARGIDVGWHSSPTIRNCTLSSNTDEDHGGGLCVDGDSSPTFTDCTFYSNSIPEATGLDGGALVSHGSCPTIGNCTFIRNSSPNYAAGIYMTAGGSAVAANTVIAFSTDGRAAFKVGSGDPTFTHCVVRQNSDGDDLPGTQHDNLVVDARLCDIYIGDATVCANSPCLPGSPDNPWGEPVGAHGQGCGDCKSPVREATWGAIKRTYR